MSDFVSLAELERRYGPLPADQLDGVQDLLDTAEAKVRQRVPTLDARISAGKTNPTLVRNVLVEMVTGVLRNPNGLRSTSRGEGPFTESATFDSAVAAGRLTLTRTQLYDLGEPRGARTVPVGDDALRRPLRNPCRGVSHAFSNVTVDDEDEEPW